MRARFDTRLILCVLLMMSASGGLAFADNAERMAEMQKALNVEVLAQPFSVAEPAERPVVTEQTQNQSFVSRCSPCGWPLGYPLLMLPCRHDALTYTVVAVAIIGLLTGCAATHTSIAKQELDVQTKMSEAVFLEPVSPAQHMVFVQVRNTSDRPNFDIGPSVKLAIVAKGYLVTGNPDTAHYKLQAQVLSVSKSSPTAAGAALHDGFGSTVMGAGTGAMSGAMKKPPCNWPKA